MRRFTAFYILAAIVMAAILLAAFPGTRRWLFRRFKTLDYLSDYITAFHNSFLDIVWGVSVVGVIWAVPFLVWGLITQFVSVPAWLSWIAICAACLITGYYIWRMDHMRLERKIEIVQITPREWPVQSGEPRAYQRARAYQIEIINRSEAVTVENVSIQLSAIEPKWSNWEFLPIPLHLRHDNPSRPEDQMRSFSLDPGEQRNIDFVSAFEGDNRFSVVHVVHGATWEVPYTDRNRLQVRITARDMPASFFWFKVWRDGAGRLLCEIEA